MGADQTDGVAADGVVSEGGAGLTDAVAPVGVAASADAAPAVAGTAGEERTLSPGVKPLLVLGKIRQILDCFRLSEPELSLGRIRELTGMPTSTVQRLVANLVAAEFLDRQGERYRIGVKLAFWAAPALRGRDELEAVRPVLERLRELTGETAALFRREGTLRVCVAMAETGHAVRRAMHVGHLSPAHTGSAGRVLLAWDDAAFDEVLAAGPERVTASTLVEPEELRAALRATRRDGYAITSDERDEGATGIAAPVFDAAGRVVAAMSVSGPSVRFDARAAAACVETLVSSAERATRLIGGRLPD